MIASRQLFVLRGKQLEKPLGKCIDPSRQSLVYYRSFHTTRVRPQNYYDSSSSGSAAGAFFKFLGLSGLVIGAPLGYATYDPKFRARLEEYLPFTKPILDKISPAPTSPSPAAPVFEKPKYLTGTPSMPTVDKPKAPPVVKIPNQPAPKGKEPPAEKDAEDIDSRPDELVAKTGAIPTGTPKVIPVPVPDPPAKSGNLNNQAVKENSGKLDAETVHEPAKPVKESSIITPSAMEDNSSKAEILPLVLTTKMPKTPNQEKLDHPAVGDARSNFEAFLKVLEGRQLTPEEERLVEAVVNATTERLEHEWENYVLELEEEHEWELQTQLRRQIAAHADAVLDALKKQEGELETTFESRIDRRIEEERKRYNLQISTALATVVGIQEALQDRSQRDKAANKAQHLWNVSNTIYETVKYGSAASNKEPSERTAPLARYVTLAKLFCDSHPFVLSILRAIPEEALTRGVLSEDFLRERFNQVRKVGRRVALVHDDSNGLFKYFLSYLQSLLVFDERYDLTKASELTEADLDTFRILSTADKCIQRGDFETAVKFVGQLKGESRRVAEDWLKEARIYLETKQVARLLLAHATAVGLSNVPSGGKK